MTANQLANASLNESIRHNIVSEEEINRHNLALENIEYDRLQLNQYVETTKLDLQKAYNEAVISNEEEALRIKQQLADLDDYYKTQSIALKNREQYEMEDWHKIQEELQKIDQKLQNKSIEYQKHQWDESNLLKWEELNINATQNANWLDIQNRTLDIKNLEYQLSNMQFDLNYLTAQQNYNLGLQRIQKDWASVNVQKDYNEMMKSVLESQVFKNYTSGAGDIVNSLTRPFSLFNPFK